MSQPSGRPPAGAEVNVPIGAIIAALHEKYGRVLQTVLQENAELQAGIEMQGQELAYLRSVVQAQQEAPPAAQPAQEPTDGAPAPESPGALG